MALRTYMASPRQLRTTLTRIHKDCCETDLQIRKTSKVYIKNTTRSPNTIDDNIIRRFSSTVVGALEQDSTCVASQQSTVEYNSIT